MDDAIQIHIHLPEALTEMVKASGERAIHVHLPDGLLKVVRDFEAEVLHERQLMRMAIEAQGELLKLELAPHITIQPSPVQVEQPVVKVRVDAPVVHLQPTIQATLGAFRQHLVRDPLDGAVTDVLTSPENGARGA